MKGHPIFAVAVIVALGNLARDLVMQFPLWEQTVVACVARGMGGK